MSKVKIEASRLTGHLKMPPSKSAAHRALICAAFAKESSFISNIALSEDIKATLEILSILGAKIVQNEKEHSALLCFDRKDNLNKKIQLNCRESGSTLRFFIPIVAALGIEAEFIGSGLLPQRPLDIYLNSLPQKGVSCESTGGLPLKIKGQLQAGLFEMPGNISSQFITGLLFALPLLDKDSEIRLSSPLESASYVNMSLEMLERFGIQIKKEGNSFYIQGNQVYKACNYEIEGDWSQAAFFLAAGALNGDLYLEGLQKESVQGDKKAEELFRALGAQITWEDDILHVKAKDLHAININAAQIPDIVPVLSVVASTAKGVTEIHHAQRLRIKECDRLHVMFEGLHTLGADVKEKEAGLSITGVSQLSGGEVKGYNDHRIVMSFAIAALTAKNKVVITDAHSIQKSYPNFFEDYNRLGGKAYVLNLGE